jgi:hypothetical protein
MVILYTHYQYCQGAIAIILCIPYAHIMSRPSLNRDRLQLTMPKPLVEALRSMALVDGITMSAVVERALRSEHNRWKRKVSMGEFDAEGRERGTPTHPESGAA